MWGEKKNPSWLQVAEVTQETCVKEHSVFVKYDCIYIHETTRKPLFNKEPK
jgi:hypothetical protein